jgi:hypothetical protein
MRKLDRDPLMIYLNGVKFEEQAHGFMRSDLEIKMGFSRNRRFERVETGFDKSKLLELP